MFVDILFHGLLAIASLGVVSAFWSEPVMLFVLLMLLSGVALSWRASKLKLIVYLVCVVWGPLAEAVAISFGAWTYASPQFFGIPFWLAPLWGLAGLFIVGVYDALRSWFS